MEEQDDVAPPWPGLVLVPPAIVRVPACELWRAHESYAETCWLEPAAAPPGERNVAAPQLSQLLSAVAAGLVTPAPELELTSSVIFATGVDASAEPAHLELLLDPQGRASIGATAPSVRRAVALREPRRPRWQVTRPCVPRDGRGFAWAPVRERVGERLGPEPLVLDRGDVVTRVHQDGAWVLLAWGDDDHPLGWVAADAVAEWVDPWVGAWSADGEERLSSQAGAVDASAAPPAASDAPLVDATLAFAHAALARAAAAGGEAVVDAPERLPERAAQLLEEWARYAAPLDPRLASLSGTDVLLLAIAAAPSLDRGTSLRYRAFAGERALTVGVVVDLLGALPSTRVRASRRLARDQPLRTTEALSLGGGLVPSASSELGVANWVLAVLYGLAE
ncbi:MAG: hypothetical protein R3B48_08875 [Kofleriaceae bacterium]